MSNGANEPKIRTMSSANFRSNRRPPCPWSVFDAVRSFPSTPDALMSEIDAAIASTEYTRSTTSTTTTLEQEQEQEDIIAKDPSSTTASTYDAQIADEAYKAACAALAAKRPDAALSSLNVALETCPPDKPAAIAKLRSLLAIANAQLQKRQQHKHHPTPN